MEEYSAEKEEKIVRQHAQENGHNAEDYTKEERDILVRYEREYGNSNALQSFPTTTEDKKSRWRSDQAQV